MFIMISYTGWGRLVGKDGHGQTYCVQTYRGKHAEAHQASPGLGSGGRI